MRDLLPRCLVGGVLLAGGCVPAQRGPLAPTESALRLQRVVLYRSGVGYFERGGPLKARELRLRCRKDQINDLLKSLTVIDRRSGRVLSVSLPLDRDRLASAADLLGPGRGGLGRLLDALRGARVEVRAADRSYSGRVLLVEEPPGSPPGQPAAQVSLLDGDHVRVLPLAQVSGVRLLDSELALQLHHTLDSSSGEGLFKQVPVELRLSNEGPHDLLLSYVSSAAVWQPSYRLVLPESGAGDALLQAFAVVANHSGEDWRDVRLTLTSASPSGFRYDLHTPREVQRPEREGHLGAAQRAAAAAADPSSEREREVALPPSEPPSPTLIGPPAPPSPGPAAEPSAGAARSPRSGPSAVDPALLQRSAQANAQPRPRGGQTSYELRDPVTLPDGTATMVAILNQSVPAEQALLFRPGGSGPGFEHNPYRVVRFKNRTPYLLEPGPISVYASGGLVGEGMADPIAADAGVIIPFAVEPAVVVQSAQKTSVAEERALQLRGGALLVESAQLLVTRYTVRGPRPERPYRVLLRHPRAGGAFALRPRPEGTEELADAYLIPVNIPAGPGPVEAQIEVVERQPQRATVALWDGRAAELLGAAVATAGLDAAARERLAPVLVLRRDMTRIEGELAALRQQQQALDQQAQEARANLDALKRDPKERESPGANALRERLSKRLEALSKEAAGLLRKGNELTSQRQERKLRLEEKAQGLSLRFADPAPADLR